MLILVSGEGPTDIGQCSGESPTGGAAFRPGPMAWLVDQIAEASEDYPFLASGLMCCVSEQTLSRRAKALRPPSLPGHKRGKETAFYFRNARALAITDGKLATTSGSRLMEATMHYQERITLEPGKRSGKPCIRGLRITVQDVLDQLAAGLTIEEIIADFPELEPDDILACLNRETTHALNQ